ncbi:MAG: SH3 domain-containing protein [Anaerolineae bacterium]|nr:SH3 domain-containing protein [Anaerolineae bacterium]
MAAPLTAYIRGLPETPSIREINIRSGPGTQYAMVFKQPVGLSGLPVLDAKPDEQGNNFQGKVYTWIKLQFSDGQSGWARDDLLELIGDGTAFGYPVIAVQTFAFVLNRQAVSDIRTTAAPTTPAVPPAPAVPIIPAAPIVPAPIAPTPTTPPPAVIAVPAVAPAPATAPTVAPTPPAVPTGYVNMRDGANVRSGPGSSNTLLTKLSRNTQITVVDVKPDQAGGTLRWAKIKSGTVDGWMREDVLRFDASASVFGLTQPDLYPASMNDRWWVRGYEGPQGHWGWDWGARVGEPVLCGPKGALVIKSVQCTRCTPERPSFKDYGIPLSDSRSLSDPAWNFGYGHYVIVRYLNEMLPESTKQALVNLRLGGAHIFVIHAHLNSRSVNEGQNLPPNTALGTCGDTGNSEAAHLHLEMRASMNANDTNWAGMKPNLLDPTILFSR